MKNHQIALLLGSIADLMDIKGENFLKIRAYRQAAQVIDDLEEDIEAVVIEDRLKDLPGIGEALQKKISEYIKTGELEFYKKLTEEVPESLLELLKVPSLGPRKVALVFHELGITNMEELQKAAQKHQLRDLEGFGEVSEKNVLRGIRLRESTAGRALLNVAFSDAEKVLEFLTGCDVVVRSDIAGSLRRMKETIGDIDILVESSRPLEVMDFFKEYPEIERIIVTGETKTSVLLRDHIQVDVRVVPKESYGAALQYFTGSKEHNVSVRGIAIKQGFKLNEYGLFDKETDVMEVGASEEEIYERIGLKWIPPELRENRGEVDAARNGALPNLITLEDIRGDFHMHSTWSDGSESIDRMARVAKKLGYEYIAVSDHSQSLKMANGVTIDEVQKKLDEVHAVDERMGEDFKVWCGTECDILKDGSLDYPDDVLKRFDIVYAAIHTGFDISGEQATERIVKALKNKHVNVLAHPTCRMIGIREGFDLDMQRIIDTAVKYNVALEINSFPDRLDLRDIHVRMAKLKGARFAIGSDAHNSVYLPYLRYGVATARRGWLEKEDVINTYPIEKVKQLIKEDAS